MAQCHIGFETCIWGYRSNRGGSGCTLWCRCECGDVSTQLIDDSIFLGYDLTTSVCECCIKEFTSVLRLGREQHSLELLQEFLAIHREDFCFLVFRENWLAIGIKSKILLTQQAGNHLAHLAVAKKLFYIHKIKI